jgi:polyphosphate glucokinase
MPGHTEGSAGGAEEENVTERPTPARRAHPVLAIGIDIGGSGIKGAGVDLRTGAFASPRHRIRTPQPSTPVNVLPVVKHLAEEIRHDVGRADLPVGVTFPAPILDGCTMSAANVDVSWIGYAAEKALADAVGVPVVLANDGDAAGVAEMRFGAGRGHRGTVLLLTLGTGVGSALFVDGRLLPNTELGHVEIRGKDAEKRSAAVNRTTKRLTWPAWAGLLDEHMHALDRLFWPDVIILGGGVSKNADRFLPYLTVRPPVIVAELRGDAGIVGAALLAARAAKLHLPPVRPAAPPVAGSTAPAPAESAAPAADPAAPAETATAAPAARPAKEK